MKSLYAGIFFLLLFFYISCSNKDVKVVNAQCSHKLMLTKELLDTKRVYSDVFKNATLIQLDTTTEALYGEISSFKIVRDTIYIFDRQISKSLYIFSLNGSFIRKISRIGRGPGEYIHPVDFDIRESNGEILILDWTSKKLLTYDKKGNFKTDIKLHGRFTSFSVFEDKVYCLNSFPLKLEDQMLQCYSLSGKHNFSALKAKSVPVDKLIFRYGSNFYKNNDQIRFIVSEKNIVYSFKNDTISPFLSLNFSKDLLKDYKILPSLYAYSENNSFAFFKTIKNYMPYDILYNFKTKEIIPFGLPIADDITNFPVNLLGIWDKKAVGLVGSHNIPYIKSLIEKGEIEHPLLSDYVNNYKADILILYEFD